MDTKFKLLLKKLVCNKLRNIYIKENSKSKKQYLKYKGNMIHITAFKNFKKKKKIRGGEVSEHFNELIKNIQGAIENEVKKIVKETKLTLNEKTKLALSDIKFGKNLERALKVYKDHYNDLNLDEIIACDNFDFLVNLLKYIKDTYHIRTDKNVNNNYEMFKGLLQGLDEESRTGRFHSVEKNMVNVCDYKLSKEDFENFLSLINNFITEEDNVEKKKHYYIEKPHFYDDKRYELSNTSLKNFIERVQEKRELRKYGENYRPGSVKTDSIRPGSAKTDSIRPGSAKTYSTRPGSAKTDSTRPGSANPGSKRPGSANPGSKRPGSANPDSIRPYSKRRL